MKRALFLILTFTNSVLFVLGPTNKANAQPEAVGESYTLPAGECIPKEKQAQIKADLVASYQNLVKQGLVSDVRTFSGIVKFDWPVRLSQQLKDPSMYGISNYVDNDATVPNKLKDYNCGTRTYDLSGGYNHRGIDIFSWPFQQLRQANNMVEIIAAADGIISYKSDGNADNSCAMCTNCNWNAVYVVHADGSVAMYGHLKSGSLTSKLVGAAVSKGEKLGVMGSSGSSTGPHLHFEVWTGENFTQLVDPFNGNCNTFNPGVSWWNNQRAYRRPALNKIMTGFNSPVFPTCPQLETTREKNVFAFGDPLCVTNFYQDFLVGYNTKMELIQPDGAIWNTWNMNGGNNYDAAWFYWNPWYLPNTAGYWKYRVTYNGQVVTHTFYHGNTPPVVTVKPGNFNDATIWSSGAIPVAASNIFVCHPIILNQNATVNSLRVNEGGQVLVENGKNLTVTTNLLLEKPHVKVVD